MTKLHVFLIFLTGSIDIKLISLIDFVNSEV